MNKTEIESDSFAEKATSAFASVLLLAQTWRPSSGNNELPFNIPNPLPPDGVLIVIGASIFLLSIILALASIVTPLRCRLLGFTTLIGPLLSLFTMLAFVLSWLSLSSEVPDGVWWREILLWGGLGMFLFLIFRLWRAYQEFLTSEWLRRKNIPDISRSQSCRE